MEVAAEAAEVAAGEGAVRAGEAVVRAGGVAVRGGEAAARGAGAEGAAGKPPGYAPGVAHSCSHVAARDGGVAATPREHAEVPALRLTDMR